MTTSSGENLVLRRKWARRVLQFAAGIQEVVSGIEGSTQDKWVSLEVSGDLLTSEGSEWHWKSEGQMQGQESQEVGRAGVGQVWI